MVENHFIVQGQFFLKIFSDCATDFAEKEGPLLVKTIVPVISPGDQVSVSRSLCCKYRVDFLAVSYISATEGFE